MVKTSLILGGNGALGRALVKTMKQGGWNVVSLDLSTNAEADTNIIYNPDLKLKEQAPGLVAKTLEAASFYESILCVSGGFAMGSIKDSNIFEVYEQ